MPEDVPVLVLPPLPVGKSNEHIAYPGTLSLSYETLARVWTEIGESVHRAGCRRIVFFNSHGGQPQVMDIVCRELRVKLGMLAVGCSCGRARSTAGDLFDPSERRHGIHAGEFETSVMLHLHPDLVDMQHAGEFRAAVGGDGAGRGDADAGRRGRIRLADAGPACRGRLRQRSRRRRRARRAEFTLGLDPRACPRKTAPGPRTTGMPLALARFEDDFRRPELDPAS